MTRLLFCLLAGVLGISASELSISGTKFLLDGKPFPYTGVSFFNAAYNPAFNKNSADRKQWLRKFQQYGVNTLRVWSQWDNKRGFVDTCAECSMYFPDGRLRQENVERLKQICADADSLGMVVEVVLFSQESWHDGVRLQDAAASDRAVAGMARELMPYRNVVIQIWNEFDERALDHVKTVKSVDAKRIVTNSPGVAGVLDGMKGESDALDFLSPHTSRRGKAQHWQIAPSEIGYLLAKYRKPVVDDEPARNGTARFGGPTGETSPFDHILQIVEVWKLGGYVVYHHDMFQTGKGSPEVPPSGIPDPEFSPYHRRVFEFLKLRDRYMRADAGIR